MRNATPARSNHRARRPLAAAVSLLLGAIALVAAACGSSESSGDAGGSPRATAGEGTTEQASAGFPLTIEHKFGSTTLEAPPERVVTVGLTDQDPFLALGVTPVGTMDWFGDHPGAIWPWAADLVDGDLPEVLGKGELSTEMVERIAALDPDAIVGIYAGITESDYGKLAAIAPTVAQPSEFADYEVPWQDQTRIIGRILGKRDAANELVAGIEARFAEARAAHPDFEGASGVMVAPQSSSQLAVYTSEDVRGRFLASLGFEQPSEIDELADGSFSADLSAEQVDLIDGDVAIWLTPDPSYQVQVESAPLYQSTDLSRTGRSIFLFDSTELGGATSFVTVLSLPVLLDGLVPQLAAAVDGDPSTTTPTSN